MIARKRLPPTGLAGLALLVSLTGATRFVTAPVGNIILAPQGAASGEHSLKPGDVVFHQEVVKAGAAHLQSPLSLEIADKARTLTVDDVLEEMTIEKAPVDLSSKARLFCATPNGTQAENIMKATTGMLAFGLIGNLQRSQALSRFCVLDKDGDEIADAAVLVGAKYGDDVLPTNIPATRLTVEQNAPQAPPSEARLIYIGPGGLGGAYLAFGVIYENAGSRVQIKTPRVSVAKSRLPSTLQIDGGAQLTVVSFDPASNAATVVVDKPFEPGPVHFEHPVKTVAVPIITHHR